MSRPVPITIVGDDKTSADDLRSLRHWLIDVDELHGRVDLRQRAPKPGELGVVTDALLVALGSGGAVGALVSALTSWIRHRTTDVDLTITVPDGTVVSVSGRRLRAVDITQLSAEVERLTTQLTGARPALPSEPEQDVR